MFKPVSVELKSARELAKMREAGRLVSEVLAVLAERVEPGVATRELDAFAGRELRRLGAEPAFLGYRGYPAVLCASVNDEVVHGIPSGKRTLKEGDIISLDLGCRWKGFYGDAAVTVAVGRVSEEARRLMAVTLESLDMGIAMARAENRLGDVSAAIQGHVEAAGFSAVREFVGHGIGRALHEDPAIPNVGQPGTGIRLRPGMVLALEPMVNAGGPDVRVLEDGWTAVTKDGSLSAHFEHMVAVTDGDPDILTRRD